jgi:hypothetical protein
MFAAQLVVPFVTEPLRQTVGPASVFVAFGAAALAAGLGFVAFALNQRRAR